MEKILVIAPHRDDEILGCGGTIAKNIACGNQVYICEVTSGVEPLFTNEAAQKVADEEKECHQFLGINKTFHLNFPAAMLDTVEKYKINQAIAGVIQEVKPDIVYIPHYGDMHTDHQIVADAAMVCVRPIGEHKVREIYTYETLSETEWNYPEQQIAFIPNVYEDISDYLEIKLRAMEFYQSQLKEVPHPRSIMAIKNLAFLRGSQAGMCAAECFRLIRKRNE